jgi:hypothetical protein
VANFSFSLKFSLYRWRFFYYVVPSLKRGLVCNLLLLLGLASAVLLGSEPCGTQDHILLSIFLRLPQPGGLVEVEVKLLELMKGFFFSI